MGIANTILNTEQKPDNQLLNSNRESFCNLYRQYAPALNGLIKKMLPDATAADEALQLTFLEIWTRRGEFERERLNLFSWMARIARNCALEGRKKIIPDGEIHKNSYIVNDVNISTAERVNDSHHDQKAFELIYNNGATAAAAANAMAMTETEVKIRLRNATNNFKTLTR